MRIPCSNLGLIHKLRSHSVYRSGEFNGAPDGAKRCRLCENSWKESMPSNRLHLFGYILALCTASRAQEYLPPIPVDHPAIRYFQGPLADPASRLAQQLQNGTVKLEARSDVSGYLASLLEHLGIRVDSQALVFSRTSFQAPTI